MSLFSCPKTQLHVLRHLDENNLGESFGFVYIIEQYPYAKIGYATNPEARLAGLQSSSPTKMRLLCVAPGSLKMEQAIHKILREAGLCVRGEWYRLDDILHVFETFHRLTTAAIAAAKYEPISKAEPTSNDVYYFRFQWCCHEHYAHHGRLSSHLVTDHQLDHGRAAEMARIYLGDPTLVGIKCRGECKETNLEDA